MRIMERPLDLSRDGWIILSTGGVRNFAYGFLSVVLGLYLAGLGLRTEAIGAIFTAALAGGAAMTVALTAFADRLGRRRILLLGAVLMAMAGAVFALTDNVVLLMVAAVVGTVSPSGKEVGPFLSVEQAALPETTATHRRTDAFSAYNLVSYLAGACGSLMVGLPLLLGLAPLEGYRSLVWGYAVAGVVLLVLYAGLSHRVEALQGGTRKTLSGFGLHRSRSVVAKLGALFAVDAFAGGFVVQGFVAYWFYLRYGADPATLGAIFFGTNLLSGLSLLAASPVARRIGLLNTMVFTHLSLHLVYHAAIPGTTYPPLY